VSRDVARVLRLSSIACALVLAVGVVVLWPDGGRSGQDPLGLSAEPIDAHVTGVEDLPCTANPEEVCAVVSFELRSGPRAGTGGSMEQGTANTIEPGDDIQVTAVDLGGGATAFSFYEYQRSTPLLLLVGVFVLAVVALGRWRGLGALAGLGASLGVIIWFALPSIADGNGAVAVALVTAGVVAVLALYLAHGPGPSTDVALLSTLTSLALTGLLAWLFVEATHLTGFSEDASFVVGALGADIDPRGLLLAGIVIGSLGVLDDVTVTQVSAVWALHSSRPDQPRRQLARQALVIGRDHISSTVNTLFLAYAGATLPLLLLFSSISESVAGVSTREVVATEIVRALVGSIGLVAAVPAQHLARHGRGHLPPGPSERAPRARRSALARQRRCSKDVSWVRLTATLMARSVATKVMKRMRRHQQPHAPGTRRSRSGFVTDRPGAVPAGTRPAGSRLAGIRPRPGPVPS
jgi:uncharacterized membrane protein